MEEKLNPVSDPIRAKLLERFQKMQAQNQPSVNASEQQSVGNTEPLSLKGRLQNKIKSMQAGAPQVEPQQDVAQGFGETLYAGLNNAVLNFDSAGWKLASFVDTAISKVIDTAVTSVIGKEGYQFGSPNAEYFLNKINENNAKTIKTKEVFGGDTTAPEIAAIALGSSVDFLRSMVTGAVSGGVIPMVEMAQGMYIEGVNEKAKRLGVSPIQLIQTDQDDEFEPYLYGGISAVMEKIGIKQFDDYLKAIPADKRSAVTKWLFASMKEGGTEYAQGMMEVLNRARAQGTEFPEAISQIYDYATGKDGLETFVVSTLGAGVLGSPKLVKNLVSGVKKEQPEVPATPPTKAEVKPKISEAMSAVETNVGTVADPQLSSEIDELVNQFANIKESTAPEVVVETENGLEESNIPIEAKLTEEPGRIETVAKDPVVQDKILQVKDKASLKDAITHFYQLDKKALTALDAAKVNFQATVLDWVATNRAKKQGISKEDWYRSRIAGVTTGMITPERFEKIKSQFNQELNEIVFHGGANVDFTKPIMKFGGVLHVGNMGTAREFRGFDPANVLNVFKSKGGKGLEIQDFGTDLHTEQIISSTEADSGKSFLDFAREKGLADDTAQRIQANAKLTAEDVDSIYSVFKDSGINKFSRSEVIGQAVASQFARENGVDYFYYKNTAEAGKAPSGETMVEEAEDGEFSRSSLTEVDTQGMPIDRENISFAIVNPAILQKVGETEADTFEGQKQFLESIGEDTTRILYQDQQGDSSPRAQVGFMEDGRAIISAVTSPDITSFVHEFSHVLRRDLTDVENEALEKAFGLPMSGEWTVEAEEKFAKSFERYVADGKLPDNIPGQFKDQVKAAFDKLSEWFKAIHEAIKGNYNVEAISPEIRSVLDAIVTGKGLEVNVDTKPEGTANKNAQPDTGSAKESRATGKRAEKPKVKEDATDKKQKQESVRKEPKKGAEERKEEKPSASDSVQRTEEVKKEVKKDVSKQETEKAAGEVSQKSDAADAQEGADRKEDAGEQLKGKQKKEPAKKAREMTFSSIGFSKEEIASIREDLDEGEEIFPHSKGVLQIVPLDGPVSYYDKGTEEFYDRIEDIPDASSQKKIDKLEEIATKKELGKYDPQAFVTNLKSIDPSKISIPQRNDVAKAAVSFAENIVKFYSTSSNKTQRDFFLKIRDSFVQAINDSVLTEKEIDSIYEALDRGESNILDYNNKAEAAKISAEKRAVEKVEKEGVDVSSFDKMLGDAKRALDKSKANALAHAEKVEGLKVLIKVINKKASLSRGENNKIMVGPSRPYKDINQYKEDQKKLEKYKATLSGLKSQKKDILNALSKAYYNSFKASAIYKKNVKKEPYLLEIEYTRKQQSGRPVYKEKAINYFRNSLITAKTSDVEKLIQTAKSKAVPSFSKEKVSVDPSIPVVNADNFDEIANGVTNNVSHASNVINTASARIDKLSNMVTSGDVESKEFSDLRDLISKNIESIQALLDSAFKKFKGLDKYRGLSKYKADNKLSTIVPNPVKLVDKDNKALEDVGSKELELIKKEYNKSLKAVQKSNGNILDQPSSRVNVNQPSQRAALIDSVRNLVEGKFSTKQQYDQLIKAVNERLKNAGIVKLNKKEIEDILKNTESGLTALIENEIRKEGKKRPAQVLVDALKSLKASAAERVAAAREIDALILKGNSTGLTDEELQKLARLPLVGIVNATLDEKRAAVQIAKDLADSSRKAVKNARAAATDRSINASDEMFIESILGSKPDANGVYEITAGRRTYRFRLFDNKSAYDEGEFIYRNGIIYEVTRPIEAGSVFSRNNVNGAGSINIAQTKIEFIEAKKQGGLFNRAIAKIQSSGLLFDGLYSFLDKLSFMDKQSQSMESKLVKNTKQAIAKARMTYTKNTADDMGNILQGIARVLGETDIKKVYERIGKLRTEVVDLKFEDDNGAMVTVRKTKATLISDYVRMIDPNAAATYEAMKKNKANDVATDRGWSDNKAAAISQAIDPEMKAIADFVVKDGLSDIFSRINSAYRNQYGHDLVREESYFPWKRHVDSKQEASSYFLLDKDSDASSIIRAVTNENTISRTSSTSPFKDSDFFEDLFNYIDNANYYSSFLSPMKTLSNVLQSEHNSAYISSVFGPEFTKTGQALFANLAANRAVGFQSNKAWNFLRQGVVIGSLGGNLSLIPKQLISMPAYANALPTGQWVGNMATLPIRLMNGSALETYRMMYNTEFIRNRFRIGTAQGANPDLIENAFGSVQKAIDQYKNKGRLGRELATAKLIRALMFPTLAGDFGSVMIGGEPVFRAAYEKELAASGDKQKALEAAEVALADATSQTQQSDYIEDRGLIQTSSSFQSLLTTFMSTPILYGRMVSGAVRDLVGGKGNPRIAAQKLVLFTYILPSLFYAVSSGSLGYIFGDDEDERFDDKTIHRNGFTALLGLIQHVPIVYPLLQNFVDRAVFENKFRASSVPALGRVEKIVERTSNLVGKIYEKDQISNEDLIKLGTEASSMIGVNIKSATNLVENWGDLTDGNDYDPMTQLFLGLGYSKEALGLRKYGEKESNVSKPSDDSRRKVQRRRPTRRRQELRRKRD
jgi:hypothetical protein